MAKFKVVTPAGVTYAGPGAAYDYEMEALTPIGAEIVEIAAKTDDEFAAAARDADALYAKGRPITKRIIDGLERCKVIAEPACRNQTMADHRRNQHDTLALSMTRNRTKRGDHQRE